MIVKRRRLKFGVFSFKYTTTYYHKVKNRYTENNKYPNKTYRDSKECTYIEGEEDDVWRDIINSYGHSESKRITLTNKSISELADFGYSNANKDGSIYIQE